MEAIEIVRTKAELPDTSYFEFLPGPYRGEHWAAESVYVQEEIFCLIEPIIRQHHPGYDHYSHSSIPAVEWSKIIADLQLLANRARSATSLADLRQAGVGFHRRGIDTEFEQDFTNSAHALANLADDLSVWLRDALRDQDVVSVLGM
jgi:hypothetical protein